MEDLAACFCLPKDCTEDLAACFGLCMNYVEDLDAYFCLSTSYMNDIVADMNYNLVLLVLPCRDVEGGALLQQDGGAGPPLQGRGRRSSTTTRWCCSTPAWTGRSNQGISCRLPRRSAAGQGAAPAKKRCPPRSSSRPGSGSRPAGVRQLAGERQRSQLASGSWPGEQQLSFELVLYTLLSILEVPFEVNKNI